MPFRDDLTTPPAPAGLVPQNGMWGKVALVETDQVTISVEEFDGGEHSFGPVLHFAIDAQAVRGDKAFLHFDQFDQPALAVVWGTGAPLTGTELAAGAFYAYRNAALAVETGDTVPFDTERFDVSGWHDTATGRYAPGTPGYYRLGAHIAPAAAIIGDLETVEAWQVQLFKNGVLHVVMAGSVIVQANGTSDYFDIRVVHDRGGSVNIEAGAAVAYFCGELVGHS